MFGPYLICICIVSFNYEKNILQMFTKYQTNTSVKTRNKSNTLQILGRYYSVIKLMQFFSYYNSYFLENANNSKRIWNGIKEIVRFKSKVIQKITKISKGSIEITDPKQIADEFHSYFVNVGDQLASQIPSVNEFPMNYLKCPSSSSFYFFQIIASEIEDEISNLKTGKSTGPCSIPVNTKNAL